MSLPNPHRTNTAARSYRPVLLPAILLVLGLVTGAAFERYWLRSTPSTDSLDSHSKKQIAAPERSISSEESGVVRFPENQWKTAGIALKPAALKPFEQSIRLTGKVSLNEDRIAHIYPMVEGTVQQVNVGLGQVVQANDLLVTIHSREVGKAKLELYQARLSLEMAKVKFDLQNEITNNSGELLVALRSDKPIQSIESQFRNRGMGDFRERLLSAYANYLKSQSDVQRLEAVSDSGAISAKQLIAAKTSRDADLATYQSRIEQIEYELKTSQLLASQTFREAETRVSVAETNLRILGCDEKDIQSIDPDKQGEKISDYAIRAPFDGTVIAKHATLKEQARPDIELLSIADLSHVWITADVYESNVPLLNSLTGKTLTIRNAAWPDRSFTAQIFYTGEIMDDRTRTIAMRAIADNQDHLLKPGMFVNIELPSLVDEPALQIPKEALLEHQGKQFVFVRKSADEFEQREIHIGNEGTDSIIIKDGLKEGDEVVTSGGFILKSKMLASLMGEE